jgi:phospholipid-binding lipoprotein MlaA
MKTRRPLFWVVSAVLFSVLTGCATTQDPQDPFESYNRAMFSFNEGLDKAILEPTAQVYQDVTPSFVQTGVGNFFGNLGDVWTAGNTFLQGRPGDAMSDVMRVAVNSVLGLGGLLDISSEAGLVKHREDFGQTLGVWGVPAGPYVVLPVFGASTIRDSAALPVDMMGDLWVHYEPDTARGAGVVLRVLDRRAAFLEVGDLVEAVALDKYIFVRDAYLQRRQGLIQTEEQDLESQEIVN